MIDFFKKPTVLKFDELPSTYLYLKENATLSKDVAVFAKKQSNGIGTKGRSFSSDVGGVYFSRKRTGLKIRKDRACSVLFSTAVAVVKTLKKFGVDAAVKWPNDVYVNGKKIAGILTETVCGEKYIEETLVGIGLNVNNRLEDELKPIAISMRDVLQKEQDIDKVERTLLYYSSKKYSYRVYKKHVGFLGGKIRILIGSNEKTAVMKDVLKDGRLLIETDGKEEKIAVGEITKILLSVPEKPCENG